MTARGRSRNEALFAIEDEVGGCARALARLSADKLAAVLAARPDACAEPVPRGFARLAHRLCGAGSLGAALGGLDRDEVRLTRAVAALADDATEATLVAVTGSPAPLVTATIDRLAARALAWRDAGRVVLPPLLSAHWVAAAGSARPAARIARDAVVEDIRAAVEALGLPTAGLRKPELVAAYVAVMDDLPALRERMAQLPPGVPAGLVRRAAGSASWPPYRDDAATQTLHRAGLALRVYGRPEVSQQVLTAAWLAGQDLTLTGAPQLPRAAGTGTGEPEAQSALAALTALLDDVAARPVPALRKGGIGVKERARLGERSGVPGTVIALYLDVAFAGRLLVADGDQYAVGPGFPSWREDEPGRRWAFLAVAWHGLAHAPTHRQIDGKEVAAPMPFPSVAGQVRRALLGAARGGAAPAAAAAAMTWSHPLLVEHGADAEATAALAEAELLGLANAGALTALGEALATAATAADPFAELAAFAVTVLKATPCTLLLQSDLTAVVSGQPDRELAELLSTAAVSEARGGAAVWRFAPASVRHAFDLGWTAEDLLAVLRAHADRGVPQPLEYLINDVARRHGHVRVRAAGCVLVGEAALIAEITATRSLRALRLQAVASTVLVAPGEPEQVVAALRTAGLYPVTEDGEGVVVLPTGRSIRPAPDKSSGAERRAGAPPMSGSVARMGPADLARRLLADPSGTDSPAPSSKVATEIERYNPRLGPDEVDLLADAIENAHGVQIGYVNRQGSATTRAVTPMLHAGSWMQAWCHLRNAEREFLIGSISSVAPVP